MVSQSESRRAHKPQQWEGDRLKKRDNEREILYFLSKIVKYALRAEKMVESALRADSTLFLIGWYHSLRKIFFMGEFQRIWGVSPHTHAPLATQDAPLFWKHIIWISGLKLSINSRSHTVFFSKGHATGGCEGWACAMYIQQWWKLYIELVNQFCPLLSRPPHLNGY